jgi:RNA polymerase sigma factor (sigma-70 family)
MRMKKDTIDHQLILDFKKRGSNESLIKMFDKYKPLINSLWRHYYLHDMELEDWHQEALIILVKNMESYDLTRGVSFGTLYKVSLKNHLYDILRRHKAKKRLPMDKIVSYSADEEYYQNHIKDSIYMNPEQVMNVKIDYEQLISKLSTMETEVATSFLEDLIYKHNGIMPDNNQIVTSKLKRTDSTVKNCLSRIKLKWKKIINDNKH